MKKKHIHFIQRPNLSRNIKFGEAAAITVHNLLYTQCNHTKNIGSCSSC